MSLTVKTLTVVLSDRSQIIVSEANWPISMKLSRLEQAAEATPLTDPDEDLFHRFMYPKLAACSEGDVPDEQTAMLMSTADLDLWFEAARELNPSWWLTSAPEEPAAVEKKRSKRAK